MTRWQKVKRWWHDFSAVKIVRAKGFCPEVVAVTKNIYPATLDLYCEQRITEDVPRGEYDFLLERMKREAEREIRMAIPIEFVHEFGNNDRDFWPALRSYGKVKMPELIKQSQLTIEILNYTNLRG